MESTEIHTLGETERDVLALRDSFEIGKRYRVRWVDRDYETVELVGTVANVGERNVLLDPDGWPAGEFQSIGIGRLLEAEEVVS